MSKNNIIRPYGDTSGDGKMQLSFSLPVPPDAFGKEAARLLLERIGFESVEITCLRDLREGYTHFIAYAVTSASVDTSKIKVKVVETPVMDMEATDAYISEHIGRKLTVVGACIESDAHTVGIDAIMNMKGYAGHYGLERYNGIRAYNLGSQVPNAELIRKALEVNADVLLVSQTVTQKDIHLKNLEELVELLEAEGLRGRFLLLCGGARITHELAKELGYDAGFGPGSYASDVASFAVQELAARQDAKTRTQGN